jgi:hypothetical protein
VEAMNIFYISKDPVQAAEWMVDKHVVKMILESAQLLSTAHRILDGEENLGKSKTGRNVKRWILPDSRENVLYSATHINHPSAVWCRQSVENYNWLADHMFALLYEYTYRYNKQHKIEGELSYMLQSPPFALKEYDMTVMPSAMAGEYKISDDPLVNYRNYYKVGKVRMHKWTNRQPPEWIND